MGRKKSSYKATTKLFIPNSCQRHIQTSSNCVIILQVSSKVIANSRPEEVAASYPATLLVDLLQDCCCPHCERAWRLGESLKTIRSEVIRGDQTTLDELMAPRRAQFCPFIHHGLLSWELHHLHQFGLFSVQWHLRKAQSSLILHVIHCCTTMYY